MSKKQKRQVSQKEAAVKTEGMATTAGPTYVAPGSSRRISTAEFKPDYSYILKDLRRIGILAGSFFGILVILSFFLR